MTVGYIPSINMNDEILRFMITNHDRLKCSPQLNPLITESRINNTVIKFSIIKVIT